MPETKQPAALSLTATVAALIALAGAAAAPQAHARASLIVSPGADAVMTQAPVRVVVRAPTGAKVKIDLGRRDVTRRFRARGGKLVGKLNPGDGVRPGRNLLLVKAKRSGKRAQTSARSFFLVRRSAGLVKVKLVAGRLRTAQIDVAEPRQPRSRRLAAVRRERRVRIWLNGRPVSRTASTAQRTRYTLSLSPAHGLRFGTNTLRVRVVEPKAGRYARVERTFKVARDAPLANAGRDRSARRRGRLRLGGNAHAARNGRLRYRWTIVSKPKGSRAKLARSKAARPTLMPDRPGRYVVRQSVTEKPRATGATAAGAASASVDEVGVTVTPPSTLVKLSANANAYDPRGIQVGGTFYQHPGPGSTIQWLTLDRATLQPSHMGNSWCCGDGDNSLDYLSQQLSCRAGSTLGLDQLVVLTVPENRITVGRDQVAELNAALQALGVDSLPDPVVDGPTQSAVVVGIPCAGAGTGWVKLRGPGESDGLPSIGWLMPDGSTDSAGALRLRFQPERLLYDTSSQSTADSNRMTFNGKIADAFLHPDDYVDGVPQPQIFGGFHVVAIDPRDLSIVDNRSYRTSTSSAIVNAAGIAAMANFLYAIEAANNYVAVQSIGTVKPDDPTWYMLDDALDDFGANPDIFNRANGSYAFFGGPPLARNQVVQSSSVNVIDPTTSPPVMEPGKLRGRARIQHDGSFVPVVPEPTASAGSLYDILFSPTVAKPWPTSDPQALAYITKQVLPKWSPDIRQAYVGLPNQTWANYQTTLENLPYPGDGANCTQTPAKPGSDPRFTRQQFCSLISQLQSEFTALDNVKDLIGGYQSALSRSAGQQGNDLYDAGQTIQKALKAPDTSIAGSILHLLASLADAGVAIFGGPDAIPILAGLVAASTDVGMTAATNEQAPVGDRFSTTVDQLSAEIGSNAANAANALDGVRALANSDYGRLTALDDAATSRDNNWVSSLSNQLTTGADAYFSSTLLPVAYDLWRLTGEGHRADLCIPFGYTRPPFRGLPDSSWVELVQTDFGADRPSYWGYVFNQKNRYAGWYVGYPPDPSNPPLTDAMFKPVSQGGYGINKSTFFWSLADKAIDENCYFG